MPLSALTASTWYRLNAQITKLTASSAKIDVSLVQLDASGNPTGTPSTGSIADTSLLSSANQPDSKYFTATSMWPSYKNFNTLPGPADNICYQVGAGTPPVQHTLTASNDGNGSVTLNPAGGAYNEGTTVALTPVPNSGYGFSGWTGSDAGDLIDNGDGTWSMLMDSDKAVTANFLPAVTVTFQEGVAAYVGTEDTYILQNDPTNSFGSLESVEWDTEDTGGNPATQKFGMIHFDNLFGSGAGKIPAGLDHCFGFSAIHGFERISYECKRQ